jgi:hypothetical protein
MTRKKPYRPPPKRRPPVHFVEQYRSARTVRHNCGCDKTRCDQDMIPRVKA